MNLYSMKENLLENRHSMNTCKMINDEAVWTFSSSSSSLVLLSSWASRCCHIKSTGFLLLSGWASSSVPVQLWQAAAAESLPSKVLSTAPTCCCSSQYIVRSGQKSMCLAQPHLYLDLYLFVQNNIMTTRKEEKKQDKTQPSGLRQMKTQQRVDSPFTRRSALSALLITARRWAQAHKTMMKMWVRGSLKIRQKD